jgi:hypothetical protein
LGDIKYWKRGVCIFKNNCERANPFISRISAKPPRAAVVFVVFRHQMALFAMPALHPERETPCPLRNRLGLQATPYQMRVALCEDLGKENPS